MGAAPSLFVENTAAVFLSKARTCDAASHDLSIANRRAASSPAVSVSR